MTLFTAPDPGLPDSICGELSEEDKQWFFKGGSGYKKAKAICCRCPAQVDCLAQAMEAEARGIGVYEGKRFGVWGGLTGKERQRLARGIA